MSRKPHESTPGFFLPNDVLELPGQTRTTPGSTRLTEAIESAGKPSNLPTKLSTSWGRRENDGFVQLGQSKRTFYIQTLLWQILLTSKYFPHHLNHLQRRRRGRAIDKDRKLNFLPRIRSPAARPMAWYTSIQIQKLLVRALILRATLSRSLVG